MSRILKSLVVVVALAAAAPVMGGAAPLSGSAAAHTAANSVTFEASSPLDAKAPNITSVTVSNDNTGQIAFNVQVANQAELSGLVLTVIEIDADNNPATGSTDQIDRGADYAIQLFQDHSDLFQWDGKTFSRSAAGPPETTLVFNNTPTGPLIKINNTELGNTKKFGFLVFMESGIVIDSAGNLDESNAHVDIAPEIGHGLWGYDVKTVKLKLLARQFRTIPSRPHAGGLFIAQMAAMRNDTGATLQSGGVACAATAGGRTLTVRIHKFVNSLAKCAWSVPASARGQTLRGTITVTFEGLKVRRSFAVSVG